MSNKPIEKKEGQGALSADVNQAIAICKNLGLLEWQTSNPVYPDSVISLVRGKDYITEWKTYLNLGHYDMLLTDGSILQFKLQPQFKNLISYSYYECPYDIVSYADFVKITYDVDNEGSYQYWEEYQQYRDECSIKAHVCPLRYDYSPSLYDEGVHPASHMHIGRDTEIRVGTKKIMNPISFLLFVVRQRYPKVWKDKFHPHGQASTWISQVRDALKGIDKVHSNKKDDWEVYFS